LVLVLLCDILYYRYIDLLNHKEKNNEERRLKMSPILWVWHGSGLFIMFLLSMGIGLVIGNGLPKMKKESSTYVALLISILIVSFIMTVLASLNFYILIK
jgi:hypothetical protein